MVCRIATREIGSCTLVQKPTTETRPRGQRSRNRQEYGPDPSDPISDSGAEDRQFVTALARGLDVLRAFRPGGGPLGNQEIAAATGLPRPTVSRLTYTLTRLGYLVHIPRLGKYELGAPVLALGYAFQSNLQVRHIAQPLMQDLASYADASVALASRDRLSMIYIQNCVGRSTLALKIDVGTRVAMGLTSVGRAFLAAMPDSERDYLMDHLRKEHGADWPKLRRRIEQAIREVDQRGFCLVDGEWRKHVRAVGAPVVFPNGLGVMAINCAGPSLKISIEQLESDLGPRLMYLARTIESMMTTA